MICTAETDQLLSPASAAVGKIIVGSCENIVNKVANSAALSENLLFLCISAGCDIK